MTASCTGSEARAIDARAGGEAKCEASHKIHIAITAILHDTEFRCRDAARKVVDAIAIDDRL